ncbi:hypothetical protein OIO90_003053 [Microbotryomycetes sp. JL221]|nr:hypothetical protein OIO90_003053 [Microbotryomycetes sp. JL221]
MPSRLPPSLFAQHLAMTVAGWILYALRAVLVIVSWLVLLPHCIVWIFRFLLWAADSVGIVSMLLVGKAPPHLSDPGKTRRVSNAMSVVKKAIDGRPVEQIRDGLLSNVTAMAANWTSQERLHLLARTTEAISQAEIASGPSFVTCPNVSGNLTALAVAQSALAPVDDSWKSLLNTLASDTFTGQIITSIVVIVFVIGFFLREWIVMDVPAAPQHQDAAFAVAAGGHVAPIRDAQIAAMPPNEMTALIDQLQTQQVGVEQQQQLQEQQPEHAIAQADTAVPLNAARLGDSVDHFVNALEEGARERQQEQIRMEADLTQDDERQGSSHDLGARLRRAETGRSPSPFDLAAASAFGTNMTDMIDTDDAPFRQTRYHRARYDERDPSEADSFGIRRRPSRQMSAEPASTLLDTRQPFRRAHSASLDQGRSIEDFEPPLYQQPPRPPQEPPVNQDPALRQLPVVPPNGVLANMPELFAPVPPPEPAQAPPDPVPAAAAAAVNGNADEEDGEGMAEDFLDDLDGILEAIGMRGSLLTFVQNVGMMILLVSLCLAGGVWAPLCIGRVLSAVDIIKIALSPIRLVRIFSDPIFDAALSLVSNAVRTLTKAIHPVSTIICNSGPAFIVNICSRLGQNRSHDDIITAANSTAAATARSSALPTAVALRRGFLVIADHWHRMPYETDPMHTGLCVALGFVALLFGAAWYVQSTQGDYSQQMHRAVRDGIRQQFVLLKVGAFILVEIIAFPAMCGVLLGLASLPLFPDATIASRIAFHTRAPLTGFFVVWFTGTGFMFLFASWIDLVRSFVRPGLIWFVRDPQSADFQPMREILEKPAREQARKIATSALMYAAVVFASVGTSIYGLNLVIPGLLPLHLPLTRTYTVPFDLVFYRFVVPFTLGLVDPRSMARNLFKTWAKKTAHELRLSSFVFGERNPEEEGSHVRTTWKARLSLKRADTTTLGNDEVGERIDSVDRVSQPEVFFRKDGGYGRVPAVDNIRVAPGRKMLVRVDEQGKPLDAAGARIMLAQLIEMATTRKADKYRNVYLPPNFVARICTFVYLMWFTGSLAASTVVVLPLITGRWLLSLAFVEPPHDLHAFGLGVYVIALAALAVKGRPSWFLSLRGIQAFAHFVVFGLSLALVLPTLVSIAGLVYVYVPYTLLRGRALSEPDSAISLNVWHCWSIGTLLASLGLKIVIKYDYLPRGHWLRDRYDSAVQLWTNKDYVAAVTASNKLLVGACAVLAIAVCLPVAVAFAALVTGVLATDASRAAPSEAVLQRACTSTSLVVTALIIQDKIRRKVTDWSRRKLEESYLVAKRLRNFDKADEQENTSDTLVKVEE